MHPSPSQPASDATARGSDQAVAFTFESLAATYNYLTIKSFAQTFADVVVGEADKRGERSCRILDIGCGSGIARETSHQWRIKDHAADYWGIEPDEGIEAIPGLFDHFQYALMETADLPAESFDIAYSSMVMEHVADPVAYLTAVHRCLKPGGSYLFVTPNANSFVPWATKVLHALRVDEMVLLMIQGKQKVEEYHYPVQFKCNTEAQLDRLAEATGFAPPEYVYVEGHGAQNYLRGPLRPIGRFLAWKRRRVQRPDNLATLICRMTKR